MRGIDWPSAPDTVSQPITRNESVARKIRWQSIILLRNGKSPTRDCTIVASRKCRHSRFAHTLNNCHVEARTKNKWPLTCRSISDEAPPAPGRLQSRERLELAAQHFGREGL